MIQVNTHDAKSRLSELLRAVEERHELIRICRNGKPVAELCPVTKKGDIVKMHPLLSKVRFNESPTTPIDKEDWPKEAR